MSKPVSLSRRVEAGRRHPRLFGKGLYIAALVGFAGGTTSLVFSENNWVEVGNGYNPLLIAWMAAIVGVGVAVWKDLFKSSLSDDGEIIQIGIANEENRDEPWRLTPSRIIFLSAAALMFIGVKLLSGGGLTWLAGHSNRAIIRSNAQIACRIASDVHLGRVTDRDGTLKQISAARANLMKVYPSVSSQEGTTDDQMIALGSLGMLEYSERFVDAGIDASHNASADEFFRRTLPACDTLAQY